MYGAVCAVVIAIAGSFAARAQLAGDPPQGGSIVSTVSADVVKDLAPTGKLRAAINLGNMVLAQKDAASGELGGVTVDLARELGRRLAVPVELVPFDAAGKVFDALKSGAWDIAFLAIEPVRAAEISFTAPYVIIEGVYMVPANSPLQAVADVDREGVRIAVNKGSAYDLYLTRTLKHATLVRGESGTDLLLNDKLEAAAGVKQPLVEFAKTQSEGAHHAGTVHGNPPGDGYAQGAAGRAGRGAALSPRFRGGNEGVRVRGQGARAKPPAGRGSRTSSH